MNKIQPRIFKRAGMPAQPVKSVEPEEEVTPTVVAADADMEEAEETTDASEAELAEEEAAAELAEETAVDVDEAAEEAEVAEAPKAVSAPAAKKIVNKPKSTAKVLLGRKQQTVKKEEVPPQEHAFMTKEYFVKNMIKPLLESVLKIPTETRNEKGEIEIVEESIELNLAAATRIYDAIVAQQCEAIWHHGFRLGPNGKKGFLFTHSKAKPTIYHPGDTYYYKGERWSISCSNETPCSEVTARVQDGKFVLANKFDKDGNILEEASKEMIEEALQCFKNKAANDVKNQTKKAESVAKTEERQNALFEALQNSK